MPDSSAWKPRSLADDLRQWSADRLECLLRSRPDLCERAPIDIRDLALVAGSTPSVEAALDDLTAFELAVLEITVALGSPASAPTVIAAALSSAAQTPEMNAADVSEAALAALNTLRDRALLWGDAQYWHPVRAAADAFGPYPCRLYPPLAQARPYLRAWLSEPSALTSAVAACSADAQTVLTQLAWQGPVMQVAGADRLRESGVGPIADLLRAGLVLAVDESSVAVPREVALHIRSNVWLPLPPLSPNAVDAESREFEIHPSHAAAALAATQDALKLVRALHTFHPKIGKGGQLNRTDVTRLASHLGWSPDHLMRWLALAMAADLVGVADSADEAIAATGSSTVWLDADPGSLWWHLAQALLAHGGAILCAARTGVTDPVHMDADDVRRGGLCMRAWLRLTSIGVPNGDVDRAWVALRPRLASQHPPLANECRDMAAILSILCTHEPSGLAAALLTDAAHLARLALEAALPAEVSSVIVQPDHTVIAPGRLRSDLKQTLLRFSELISEDQALVARITAAKVREAITLGLSAQDITDFLETWSQTPAPQSLTYMIADCGRSESPVSVEPVGAVVRTPTAGEAQRLLAEPRLSRLGLTSLGEQTLVSREPAHVVFEALRSAGVHLSGSLAQGLGSGQRQLRAAHGWGFPPAASDAPGIARGLAQVSTAGAFQAPSAGVEWAYLTFDTAASLMADCLSSQRPIHVQLEAATGEITTLTLVPLHVETNTATVYDLTHAKVRNIALSKVQCWAPAA